MSIAVLLVAIAAGCKEKASSKATQGSGSPALTGKDADVRSALVLEAALEKAKGELTALEAAQPRDEQAIAKKKEAIDAVQQTLDRLRKRRETEDRQHAQ